MVGAREGQFTVTLQQPGDPRPYSLNTLLPRGRDDSQEPRSPLLPTKAQEAQPQG